MKSVLISIKPKWCELIASGRKTVEVRKTAPKLELPFKVYIYCTKDRHGWFDFGKKERLDGKVIGEFVCDRLTPFDVPYPAYQKELDKAILEQSCLTYYQLHRYAYHDKLYGWHISDLVIYDEPKPLTDFVVRECLWHNIRNNGCIDASGERCYDCRLKRPPQSWRYVEG